MKHISDDDLLKYELELIDAQTTLNDLKCHLENCIECKTRLDRIRRAISSIGGIRAIGHSIDMPHAKHKPRQSYDLFKVAAVLIIGFILGYGASNWIHEECVIVTPSQFSPAPPVDSLLGLAASDATDIHYDPMDSTAGN